MRLIDCSWLWLRNLGLPLQSVVRASSSSNVGKIYAKLVTKITYMNDLRHVFHLVSYCRNLQRDLSDKCLCHLRWRQEEQSGRTSSGIELFRRWFESSSPPPEHFRFRSSPILYPIRASLSIFKNINLKTSLRNLVHNSFRQRALNSKKRLFTYLSLFFSRHINRTVAVILFSSAAFRCHLNNYKLLTN